MSGVQDIQVIRFASAQHWGRGIAAATDIGAGGMAPVRLLAPTGRTLASPGGAHAPTIGPDGTLYWCSGAGDLMTLAADARAPCPVRVPELARSSRLVAGRRWLWACAPDSPYLRRFDVVTLREQDAAPAPGPVIDIAGDGRDGLWVLYADGASQRLWRQGADTWAAPVRARSLVRLGPRLVLLAEDGGSLVFVESQAPDLAIKTIQPDAAGFNAERLDSDTKARLFLTGAARTSALWLDLEGGLVQQIAAPVDGVGARGARTWLAGNNGVAEYGQAGASDGTYLSPRLVSPVNAVARGWLRAELTATLPRGSRLEVTVLSTDNAKDASDADAIAGNADLTPEQRQTRIATLAGQRTSYTFDGSEAAAQPCSVPLFDHTGTWLWLAIKFVAAADGALPELGELRVLYPNISLMQHLPAIFHGDVTARSSQAGDQGSVLRRLVGVLETTTQGLDRTIASLAANLQPASAPDAWLNHMARWFDLPWHDALPIDARRNLLAHGAALLAQRGTRAGLALLMKQLAPDARVEIVDHNAETGLLVLGGKGHAGSALPGLIAGLAPDVPALSRRLALGQVRLNRPATVASRAARFVDLVTIEVHADRATRAALAALLPDLVAAMVPAGMRAIVRWRSAPPSAPDDGVILDAPSLRRLGQDSELGMTMLAGRTTGIEYYLD